ncbi:MAG: hypothetical protein ACXVBF_03760, partial [Flavisolibacter sp.]
KSLLARRLKKVTISFPSATVMWDFFESSEIKEFRLDSSKCSVTGRFLPYEIERARKEMNASIEEMKCA